MSISHQRLLKSYPAPKQHLLVIAESEINEESVSAVVSRALEKYYANMCPKEKAKLLAFATKISKRESKNSY